MSGSASQSLALAIGAGMLVSVLCERLRFPALLPLLGAGLLLGVSGVGVIDGGALGDSLGAIITVSIGLLIFEGTLHLNREELSRAPGALRGLVTVGALVSWAGATALAHLILGFTLAASILLGATLIVTGPTVVQPILRRMRVTPRLHTALGAEAVFIDPIGVVATVTTLEIIRSYIAFGGGSELWIHGAWMYAKPLVGGAVIGAGVGIAGFYVLRAATRGRRLEPKRLNFLFLGICMSSVGLGEVWAPEAGLGAVTVTGVILARLRLLGGTELRAFKEQLASILVGTLFVLLASRFPLAALAGISWREVGFVAGLLILVRPLSVVVSTIGSGLSAPEKTFASLFAPRGIVALSVASIAGTELARVAAEHAGNPQLPAWISGLAADAARLELVMFVVIVVSVFLATAVSPLLARALGVRAGQAGGLILVGAHPLAIATARLLRSHNVPVRLVDTNPIRIAAARAAGIPDIETHVGDATDTKWLDDVVMTPEFGWVIGWTGNDTVDRVVARWGEDRFGRGHAGIWSDGATKADMMENEIGGARLLSDTVDAVEGGRLVVAPVQPSDASTFGSVEGEKFRLVRPGDPARTQTKGAAISVGLRVPERAAPHDEADAPASFGEATP